MPRPTDKSQLLAAIRREHAALEKLLEPLTAEQMTALSQETRWSIKDVLAHVQAWEQMCLGWYTAGQRGQTPPLPAEGYNWAQLPALNQQIFEKYHAYPLEEIQNRFRRSYRQIVKVVEGISEAELFTPSRHAWTRKNALAAYFISATSSHYDWAKKEIKKCLKGQALRKEA